MYATKSNILFRFVYRAEKPTEATPRTSNAIYRETQLVRLGRTQSTLNTNNDITRPWVSRLILLDGCRLKHKLKHHLLLRYDITCYARRCSYFFFIYNPRTRVESALSDPDFEVTRDRPLGRATFIELSS